MEITRIQSRQARDHLADIMKRATENGQITVLTRYNLDVVAVIPISMLPKLEHQLHIEEQRSPLAAALGE